MAVSILLSAPGDPCALAPLKYEGQELKLEDYDRWPSRTPTSDHVLSREGLKRRTYPSNWVLQKRTGMARKQRRWTAEEDAQLQEGVQAAINGSRPLLWREIAKSVPGRSNKDCRRRWCNSLAGSLSKGHWTESEDERLWTAVQKHGTQWAVVAQEVGTRSPDQCSSHWSHTLNPDIDFSEWTQQDDETLLQAVQQHGTTWTTIASKHLPNRTALAIRNRFNALNARMEGNRKAPSAEGAGIRAGASPHSRNWPNRDDGRQLYPSCISDWPEDEDDDSEDGGDDNDQYGPWHGKPTPLSSPPSGSLARPKGLVGLSRTSSILAPAHRQGQSYSSHLSQDSWTPITPQTSDSNVFPSVMTSGLSPYHEHASVKHASTSVGSLTSPLMVPDTAHLSSGELLLIN
ncbi:hypothetical protein EYZ11_004469 [Aspergillus tanneri]|uniref:Myb-like DNA-binding domain protein n=1 Tax=Aspergillus tanneri TaxID=1220188 RepID=A0A4S3JMT6_9EURO|nr:hypothetical protein EYZ11_004469 [Aspergillus tanneri]